MGCDAVHGIRVRPSFPPIYSPSAFSSHSGYLQSCRDIVTCARRIADTITASIPELYVLGSPPASVVAFGSRDASVNVYEVGDRMSKRGWHLNALSGPAAVHIACTVRCVLSFLVPVPVTATVPFLLFTLGPHCVDDRYGSNSV